MGASGLGTLLIEEGLIENFDRRTIRRTSGHQSAAFAKGVVALGLFDEDQLASFITEYTSFERVPKDLVGLIDIDAVAQIDANLVMRLEAIPLSVVGKTLHVAMVDPLDHGIIRQLEFFTGFRIKPKIATVTQIYSALQHLFPDFKPAQTPLESFLVNHVDAAAYRQRVVDIQDPDVIVNTPERLKAEANLDLDSDRSDEGDFDDIDLEDFGDEHDEEIDLGGLDSIDGDEASVEISLEDDDESVDFDVVDSETDADDGDEDEMIGADLPDEQEAEDEAETPVDEAASEGELPEDEPALNDDSTEDTSGVEEVGADSEGEESEPDEIEENDDLLSSDTPEDSDEALAAAGAELDGEGDPEAGLDSDDDAIATADDLFDMAQADEGSEAEEPGIEAAGEIAEEDPLAASSESHDELSDLVDETLEGAPEEALPDLDENSTEDAEGEPAEPAVSPTLEDLRMAADSAVADLNQAMLAFSLASNQEEVLAAFCKTVGKRIDSGSVYHHREGNVQVAGSWSEGGQSFSFDLPDASDQEVAALEALELGVHEVSGGNFGLGEAEKYHALAVQVGDDHRLVLVAADGAGLTAEYGEQIQRLAKALGRQLISKT